jgi:hypothetical protein
MQAFAPHTTASGILCQNHVCYFTNTGSGQAVSCIIIGGNHLVWGQTGLANAATSKQQKRTFGRQWALSAG